jgi:nucleotide-binding universal stress UspA family protein
MRTIVVGIGSGPGGAAALRWAGEQAMGGDARIIVVHAYPLPPVLTGTDAAPEVFAPDRERRARQVVGAAVERGLPTPSGIDVTRRLVPGRRPADALLAVPEADVLVVGASPRTALVGVGEHLAAHARCPVVVAPLAAPPAANRIVVGIDGSPEAVGALTWAIGQAGRSAAEEVLAVAAYLPYAEHRPFGAEFMEAFAPGAGRRLVEMAEAWLADALDKAAAEVAEVPVRTALRAGAPAEVLREAGGGAQLLVLGAHGHHVLAGRVLGSVAQRCLRHPPCPVAVVPSR